jgi:hypothetical protein
MEYEHIGGIITDNFFFHLYQCEAGYVAVDKVSNFLGPCGHLGSSLCFFHSVEDILAVIKGIPVIIKYRYDPTSKWLFYDPDEDQQLPEILETLFRPLFPRWAGSIPSFSEN